MKPTKLISLKAMKTIYKSVVIFLSIALLACSPEITDPNAGIDDLVVAAGEYPDPPPPKPDLFVPGIEEEIDWPHGETWICQPIRIGLTSHPVEFPLLDPLAGVVWPGAAIQGKSLIKGAVPDPITAPSLLITTLPSVLPKMA